MSRHIYRTTDKQQIKDCLKGYYGLVTYDGCPEWSDFDPDTENSLWFVLMHESDVAGLIKLDSLNLVTFIPHVVIKAEYRGNGSEQWGKQVATYMADQLGDVNFLVMTPYESAKNYAERVGFTLLGTMPNSIKKDGKLMDQYILTGNPVKNNAGDGI